MTNHETMSYQFYPIEWTYFKAFGGRYIGKCEALNITLVSSPLQAVDKWTN